MDIAQKIKNLELLANREKIAAVARLFVVNESIIRTIRDDKEKIRNSASTLGPRAKFCKISRSGMHIHYVFTLFSYTIIYCMYYLTQAIPHIR